MRFSSIELRDLFKAWLAISLAFAIADAGFSLGISFFVTLLISAVTVGLGFIVHELSHKLLAQHFKCSAEFRSDDRMLLFALLLSLTGFVFAAPGAVLISGYVTKKSYGKISAAGVAANIGLALLFLLLWLAGIPLLQGIALYGLTVNCWLALFNLIPFGSFDGLKILSWSKLAYGILAAVAGICMILAQLLPR